MRVSAVRNLKEYAEPNHDRTLLDEAQELVMHLSLLVTELTRENLNLKIENATRKDEIGSRKPRKDDGILYWVADEFGEVLGPLCHSCCDPAGKLIRVEYVGQNTGWQCLRCGDGYGAEQTPDSHRVTGNGQHGQERDGDSTEQRCITETRFLVPHKA